MRASHRAVGTDKADLRILPGRAPRVTRQADLRRPLTGWDAVGRITAMIID